MYKVTVIIDSCQTCAAQLAANMKSCGSCKYVAKSCCDCASSSCNAIVITLIICGTILLLGLILSILLYYMKKKQIKLKMREKEKEMINANALREAELETKKYEEKKHYRSVLVNFLENRAKEIRKEEDHIQTYESEYINELKKLAKDLIPTDPKEPTEPTNPNNPTEQTDYSRGSEADD